MIDTGDLKLDEQVRQGNAKAALYWVAMAQEANRKLKGRIATLEAALRAARKEFESLVQLQDKPVVFAKLDIFSVIDAALGKDGARQ